MKINSALIRKFNPCRDRIENFDKQYPNFNGTIIDFASLDEISYSDKVWVLTRLMSQKQKFQFALACATSVCAHFTFVYPNNSAVSNLLAFMNKIDDPATLTAEQLKELKALRCYAAAAAYAADAADAADAAAAAYAAYAAAAYAADAAAAAAAYAAYAARKNQQEYQLILMVSILNEDFE